MFNGANRQFVQLNATSRIERIYLSRDLESNCKPDLRNFERRQLLVAFS